MDFYPQQKLVFKVRDGAKNTKEHDTAAIRTAVHKHTLQHQTCATSSVIAGAPWLSRRWWHTHEGYEGSSSAGES